MDSSTYGLSGIGRNQNLGHTAPMQPVAKLRWTLAEIFSASPAKREQTTIIEEWMCSNWNGASVKHAPARDYEAIAHLSAAAAAAAARQRVPASWVKSPAAAAS